MTYIGILYAPTAHDEMAITGRRGDGDRGNPALIMESLSNEDHSAGVSVDEEYRVL